MGGREGESWHRVWLTAGEERGSQGERGGELVGRGRQDSKATGRGRRDRAKGRRGGRGQPVWGRLGMFYLEGWRDRDMPRPLSSLARSGAACSTANHPEASHLSPPAPRPARAIAPPPLLSPPRASPRPSHLRLCTLNLLDDRRVARGMGGAHSVWELRRVNVLRVLLAIGADAYLLQVSHHSMGLLT